MVDSAEKTGEERTLVVLLGDARGGECAWASLYRNLIEPNNADLALMFGARANHESSLYERAKFVWECPEYQDWGDAYDKFADGNDWRKTWMQGRGYGDPGAGLFGGVGKCPASGAIIFAMRLFALEQIQSLRLEREYDWFVITRSDHYYTVPLVWDKGTPVIHLPIGEDYGGITDRYAAVPKCFLRPALDVVGDLLRDPAALAIYNADRQPSDAAANPERLIRRAWQRRGLTEHLVRMPRTMFTVADVGDTTRFWRPSGLGELGHGLPALLKYRSELKDTIRTLAEQGIPGVPLIASGEGYVEWCKPTQWRAGPRDQVSGKGMMIWNGRRGWVEYAVQWPVCTGSSKRVEIEVLLNAERPRPMALLAYVPAAITDPERCYAGGAPRRTVIAERVCQQTNGCWLDPAKMCWFSQGAHTLPVDRDGFTVIRLEAPPGSCSPHIGGLRMKTSSTKDHHEHAGKSGAQHSPDLPEYNGGAPSSLPPARSEPKIAVCMWYDEGAKERGDLAQIINQRYCDEHGYALIYCDTRRIPVRHPALGRCPLLVDVIRSEQYDVVCWVDADAAFSGVCSRPLGQTGETSVGCNGGAGRPHAHGESVQVQRFRREAAVVRAAPHTVPPRPTRALGSVLAPGSWQLTAPSRETAATNDGEGCALSNEARQGECFNAAVIRCGPALRPQWSPTCGRARRAIAQPNILVCTWYDTAISEMGDIAKRINLRYCRKRGWDLLHDQTRRLPTRHVTWEKLSLVLHLLQGCRHDYLVWVDADAAFDERSDITLESFIESHPNADVIVQDDKPWGQSADLVNTGILIVKNTDYSRALFKAVIGSNHPECTDSHGHATHEQACMTTFLKHDYMEAQAHVHVSPYSDKLQRYPGCELGGGLAIHAAGKPLPEKIRVLTELESLTAKL